MPFTVAARNESLNAIGVDTIKLHSGDPTDGTTNVISGAESAITIPSASSGSRVFTGSLPITIPASTTVSHYTLWGSGVMKDSNTVPTAETFAGGGTYEVTSVTMSAT